MSNLFESSARKTLGILIGRIVIALTGIIFVPIYVKLLGPESYGLIAFYATLAGAMLILDLGLSTAISRQIAVLKTTKNQEYEIKDLIFSVEVIYWSVGLFAGAIILIFSNFFALHWIKSESLPITTISQTVMLIGGTLALQFPASIYNGVLIGLEKQISITAINLLFSLIKNIGVIPFLLLAETTIQNYFIWQLLSVILMTFSLRYIVWKQNLNSTRKAQFSVTQLRSIWKFAAGMAGISIITFIVRELDKIVVSKMVLLEFVGYYNLAFLISGGLIQIVSPLQIVFFPKLTALFAQNKLEELTALYHKSARWISILIFPVGLTIILFSYDLLFIWTGNKTLSINTAPILTNFTIGTIISCIMWLPYSYLLAIGNTKFTLTQNIITLLILIPILIYLTSNYGIFGASTAWMITNIGYFAISAPLFHSYHLKGQLKRWYFYDIFIPFSISLILLLIVKIVQITFFQSSNFSYTLAIICTISVAYAYLIPELRIILLSKLNSIKKNIFVQKKS